MKYTGISDKGLVRKNNEDFYAAKKIGDDFLMIVADGMGGHAMGEIASRTAVEYIMSILPKSMEKTRNPRELEELLHRTIEKANVKVYLESLKNSDYRGMGTTLTICVLREWRLFVSHIGDCRVYLLHGSHLNRLTTDHTLVGQMIESGLLSEKEAVDHPKRHVLTRSLGVNDYMTPDTASFDIAEGDLIMVCTDGLYGYVKEREIKDILRKHRELDACCNQLVEAANREGGNDNVTVLLMHCDRE